ncbi:NUDIX domain-containing protein [Quadrisphaera sp. KR29]|uniref:NUDIX domain-containing protein n=1 Tax=Quadrisphaera sp. KR29 TaxID=3461391 RepID=UPI004044669C
MPTARPNAALTADVVALHRTAGVERVLLVRRGSEPFAGSWALPGGFVEADEDPQVAALRELAEETGLDLADVALHQLGVYGVPGRDPRGRVVSSAWWVRLPEDGPAAAVTGGDDAAEASWVPVADVLPAAGQDDGERAAGERLAFDHEVVLRDALARDAAASPARAIAVRFDLPDATALAAFDALVADVLPGFAADEPGTLTYVVHAVEGEPLARVFFEEYAEGGHAAHEARRATAAFLDRVRELTGGAIRAELLVPLGAVRP